MRILIVEDNPDSRLVLQKNLEGAGYEVAVATQGAEALEMARASLPDLIISDILMPVMDGYKLCYALKNDEKLRRTPLVFYTSTYLDPQDERLAICLGASRFLIKPMETAEFMKVIKEVIEESAKAGLPTPGEPLDDTEELLRKFASSLSRKLEEKVRDLDLYRRVFENSCDGLAVVNRSGSITQMNRAYEELLDSPESQLMGTSPETYLDAAALDALRKSLDEKGVTQGEGKMRSGSGKEVPVWYTVFPVMNERNEPIARVWGLRNISQRVETEKQRRLFHTLLDFSNDAIFVINPETARIENVNERACRRLGYSREQLLGKTAPEIDGVMVTREQWLKHVAQTKQEGARTFESTHRRSDGSEFPVEVSVAYTEIGDGGYMVAIVRDITERKKAEARLIQARKEWERTFDAINDVVTVQDLDMRIIQANRAACDLFKRPLEQIVGKQCHELFCGPGKGACPDCPIFQARKYFAPRMAEIENSVLKKTFQVSVVPILDDQGGIKGVVHFARDVTDQKKLAAQLLQSQKMEAIGNLAGGVAHDFNNLLSVILGYTEMALRRLSPTDPATKELAHIESAGERAVNLVRQLLLFGRKHQQNFAPLDLQKDIKELLKMLHRVIGEDIRISLDFADDCWLIDADAGNLDQVVMNLAVNARDAMPEGGTLGIKTENVVIDAEYCRRNAEARPGRFVRLSISDTGTGMAADVLTHIFEPFFSTKEIGKGTGLGLSVVYGIVKSHKGWANVYSEPGQGSTFRLYFPAAARAAGEEAAAIPAPEMVEGHGERILIVEDDEQIRDLELSALGENGYVATGAASAEEGLECFTRQGGAFDLVFSDVVLPKMNGVTLVDRLREIRPDIGVLLCSGYADQKSRWPLIEKRGYLSLEKPFTIDKLLKAVRNALDKPRSPKGSSGVCDEGFHQHD